jgi:hypothetical protein
MKTPLALELAKAAYVGLDNPTVTGLLNAPIAAGYHDVETKAISTLLIHSGELPAIGAKALTPGDALFGLCFSCIEYIRTHEWICFDPATADGAKALEMLAALNAQGLVGNASHTAILGMAAVTTSIAKRLGFRNGLSVERVTLERAAT